MQQASQIQYYKRKKYGNGIMPWLYRLFNNRHSLHIKFLQSHLFVDINNIIKECKPKFEK
ncbi:hypothetical protein SAMN05421690_100328 [Nitrosomonas sp. Nm51]|nr:hypothetical protein SAMN05421690_100328 [Nitrosomonas sp. Nm51]